MKVMLLTISQHEIHRIEEQYSTYVCNIGGWRGLGARASGQEGGCWVLVRGRSSFSRQRKRLGFWPSGCCAAAAIGGLLPDARPTASGSWSAMLTRASPAISNEGDESALGSLARALCSSPTVFSLITWYPSHSFCNDFPAAPEIRVHYT